MRTHPFTHTLVAFLTGLALVVSSTGCAQQESTETPAPAAGETDVSAEEDIPRQATASLQPTEGNTVEGTVTFTEVEEGIRVQGNLSGLTEGEHGFHVHETGDCSAPDASSAGGHFNPFETPHGAPSSPQDQRHVGDLGNIEADTSGQVSFEIVDPLLAFDGEASILNRAVIVHSGADDMSSQPSGEAGSRLACGVIEQP